MTEEKPIRNFVLMVSLSGVGKSTYIKNHANGEFKGYTTISVDQVAVQELERLKEAGTPCSESRLYFERSAELFETTPKRIEEAVRNGENIVIDQCNESKAIRKKYMDIARQSPDYDYRFKAIVIGLPAEKQHIKQMMERAFETGRFTCVRTANERHSVEPVKKSEGFKEIKYIGRNSKTPLFHEYKKSKKPIDWRDFIAADGKNCQELSVA